MEVSHVVIIVVGCLFVFAMGCLFLLYSLKKAAVNALSNVVDKTINKATDLVSEKVLEPTMAVATESMKKGLDTAGKAVQDGFHESRRKSAGNVDIEVTRLAQSKRGKISASDVTSELKLTPDEANLAFKRLEKAGHCKKASDGIFHFVAFLQKTKVWFCEYCENKITQDPNCSECPDCGANLTIREEIAL